MSVTPAPTPDAVAVRQADDRDLDRIIELFELGSLVAGKEDRNRPDSYRTALAEIGRGPGAVLVAEVQGQVVGVCQLIVFRHLQSHGGLCAEIESVHVHPDQRGRGVGHVLMEATVQRARDLGCYRVQLTSNEARPDAHRFYQDLGFTPSHQGFKRSLP